MTIGLQTGSPAFSAVSGSGSSQTIGSNGSNTGYSTFAAVLQGQQVAAAAPEPVAVNGSPTTTQCYSYSFLSGAENDLAEIAGAQVRGMPVEIYDPTGALPTVTIMPTADAVAVMKADNIPINAPDGGLGYEYSRNYQADDSAAMENWEQGTEMGTMPTAPVVTAAIQQTMAEGWTAAQMLADGFTASQLAAASVAAAPVPTASLPVATAGSVAAVTPADPGSSTSTSTTAAPAATPVAAASDTSPLAGSTVAPPAATPVAATPVAATPVAAAPVTATPVAATPVAAAPVAATPAAAAPVAAAPVAATPAAATPATAAPAGNPAPQNATGTATTQNTATNPAAVAAPKPVAVNGRPTTTQCYSYSFLSGAENDLAEIAGAQVRGMPVEIYDPTGALPTVTIMPTDNAVAVMKANNIPINAPDGGLGYEYSKNYLADFSAAQKNWEQGSEMGTMPTAQIVTDAIQQTLAEGWSTAQMLADGFTAQQLTAAGDAPPAPIGSLA